MYAKATQQKSMASPICFLCACAFPWVESRRGNQIGWEQPFKAAVGDPTLVIRFGDWIMTEVQARFSVDAYLRDYRREPGNSALDLEEAWYREDFTDLQSLDPIARRLAAGASAVARKIDMLQVVGYVWKLLA